MTEATPWTAPGADEPPARFVGTLARWLRRQQLAWHGGNVVLSVVSLLLVWWHPEARIVNTEEPFTAEAWVLMVFVSIGMVHGLLGVGGLVLSAWWQAQAAAAIPNDDARFPPWFHGIGWFIPVAQVVLPYLTLQELLRRTGESTERLPSWWACFVGGAVLRMMSVADDMVVELTAFLVVPHVLSVVLLAVSSWLYMGLVNRITRTAEAP